MLKLEKHPLIAAFAACAALAALTTTAQGQNLALTVNPFTGAVTILNTSGSAVAIDGYQLTSAAGQLVPDPSNSPAVGWNSFTDAGLPGWAEFAPTATGLSELNLTNSTTIPANGIVSLGKAFTPNGTRDLGWGYSVITGGNDVATLPGRLSYGGGLIVEVITLRGAGNVVETIPMIINNLDTTAIDFDGYTIQSEEGSLLPAGFNGFAGRGVPGWGSFAPSANALSELNLTSSTNLGAAKYQPLGQAFATEGVNDLSFQFHYTGVATDSIDSLVVYRDQLSGDVNRDGIVNGQDIALIATNWLATGTLGGEANYDGIVNGQDIALIATHWLLSAGGSGADVATAVPEPGTLTLLSLGLLAACRMVKRRK